MEELELFTDGADIHEMERQVRLLAASVAPPLEILEAGCGRRWPLDLDGVKYRLTGIDLNAKAMELRKERVGDLDVAIVGDLRTIDLPPEQYDVIYNSFVLEHVPQADEVMASFVRWLRPGGLLLIRIPDGEAVFGFLTRITPHWFHLFYKRYIQGWKLAGQPGHGPYPTYYHPIVSGSGMRQFAQRTGLAVLGMYGHAGYLSKTRIPAPLFRMLVRTMSLCALGRLQWRHDNLTLILKKNQAPHQ
jgi:SAM-dependent methyltransferase